MGSNLNRLYLKHEPYIGEAFKEKYGIDIKKTISEKPVSLMDFDRNFIVPCWGFKSAEEYYYKASNCHRTPMIQVPTMFLNTLDDPICTEEAMEFDSFKQNPNVVLATTKHGGHTGYHESLFTYRTWFPKLAMKYFKALN